MLRALRDDELDAVSGGSGYSDPEQSSILNVVIATVLDYLCKTGQGPCPPSWREPAGKRRMGRSFSGLLAIVGGKLRGRPRRSGGAAGAGLNAAARRARGCGNVGAGASADFALWGIEKALTGAPKMSGRFFW